MPPGHPYPEIVEDVATLFTEALLCGAILGVDQTGVGRPVVDMFLRRSPHPWGGFYPTTITAGHKATQEDNGSWHVPKKDLVGAALILMQNSRLQGGPEHPEWDTFVKELQNFRYKTSLAGNETYEAWREGKHDDVVFSLAVACWIGENCNVDPWIFTISPGQQNSIVSIMPADVFMGGDLPRGFLPQ
jgi:hypothetical protein